MTGSVEKIIHFLTKAMKGEVSQLYKDGVHKATAQISTTTLLPPVGVW
jgi:hypothetical protein